MASKKSLLEKTAQTKIIIRSAFVVTLAIFIIASPLTTAIAQPPIIEDVEVPRLRIPVTLDGAITGDEWSDAEERSVYFHFYNGTTWEYLGNRSATIYLKHDCENLWICVQTEDLVEDVTVWDDYPSGLPSVMGDAMCIFYDVSGDMEISGGDDEKCVAHPSFTMDNAIIPEEPYWDQDTNLGGTLDIQGVSGWTDGWLTYELVHPLNSGDSEGNDPALIPGDSILANFYVADPEFGIENSGWAGPYNLIMAPCPVTISPTSGTVGSTVTVSGTGATANGEVRIYWGGDFIATTTANAAGEYSVDITVPHNRAGPLDIWVRDVTTGDDNWATFTVKSKIVLIPDKGAAWWWGDEIIVRGTGFDYYDLPHEPWWAPSSVTIEFNGIVWTDITWTEGDGSFEARFYVPDIMPGGTYNVTATDDFGNSASAPFTVIPRILPWPNSGSTATHVHVEGWGFASSQSMTVTFDGINVTIFEGVMTDPEGRFGNAFKVPDVPDGIYTITATDAEGNSASAPFVVPGPVIFLTPNVTVGSSIVTVTGFGFRPRWPVAITINETASMDLLYTGMMLGRTSPDEYGSFEFSFVLPITKPGIYNVTAHRITGMTPEGFMEIEAETWTSVTVVDLVMDKLIEMQGDIAVIQTEVGQIEVKLHNINATLLLIQDGIAVIQTDIGTIQADIGLINGKLVSIEGSVATINSTIGLIQTDIADIQLNVTAINGNIATIQTTLDTIEGKITSIDGNTATIETDIGTVKADISNVKGAQEAFATPLYIAIILTLISAVGVIILIILIRRKPKS